MRCSHQASLPDRDFHLHVCRRAWPHRQGLCFSEVNVMRRQVSLRSPHRAAEASLVENQPPSSPWPWFAPMREHWHSWPTAASPARLRVSQVRTALRSVAHSAMRPHRGAAPSIPVCPPREHCAPRPLRRIALWSVLRGKTIPPLHPSSASGHAVCLLGSGKPTVKTHTHERGIISSGWPPNQPASRIAKLFGKGGAGGEDGPVRESARVVSDPPGKLLHPASRRLRRP